jgi:NAD(P)-dependent dehydrogenase (short-subunit alcohol dehydrogenase family)
MLIQSERIDPDDQGHRSLYGQVAIVTGGVGGFGGAVVARLLAEGVRVIVVDQAKPPEPAPTGTSYLRGDVAHPVTARRAVATAEAAFGGLDLLVNAAATSHRGDLLSTDITCWNRVLTVNLTGTMLACQAAVPAMARRGGGAIVNLGAVHPFGDAPDQPAYAISKSAVVTLTRRLAASLASRHIRVSCVHPGAGPTARPDKEVADAVLHLLSPAAREATAGRS